MKHFFCLLFFVLSFFSLTAQTGHGAIKGRITTADHKPAEGVSIQLKNTARFAVADNDGAFTISDLTPGTYTLLISLVGHTDHAEDVTVASGETTTSNVQLQLSARELNEVVVVANKNSFKTNRLSGALRLQTPILEIPQNVQVVTSRLIYNQQIFDMLEGATRNVSGATRVEHWDNYARIFMRGSNVGAFRNGMNVSTTWGPLTEDMSMVERIEFVKGPAGFMLANGDPSGFYNVVTKKPSGRTKGEVSLSLGSFDFQRATLDLDGKLSKDGKLLYRLNLMGQLKGSHRQFDFNNRYTIVPVLKYLLDDNTSLTLEYTQQYSEVNIIGSNYSFSKRGYADLPRNFTTAEANLPKTKMNDRSVLLMFDHKISKDWKFTAQAAYFNYQQQGASLWPTGFDAANDSLMQRGTSSWDILGLSKIGQMFVNGETKTGTISHKILGGIDISNKEYFHDWNQGGAVGTPDFNIYAPVYGNAAIPTFDRSRNIRERGVRYYNGYKALYVQDELGFFDNKLRLTLAGRLTQLNTGDVYSGNYKTSRFTPRVGLSYSIGKNTAVYAVMDESFVENYGADWQGRSFDPIVGKNKEAGVKRDWMNGKWNSALSVYRITRNNVLTPDLDHPIRDANGQPTGQFYNRQSGQQQTSGVELDIKGQIVNGLDVVVNYAFTEAKTTKDSDAKNVGRQIPGSSRHVQNTWLNYRVEKGSLAGFGISAGYQYQVGRSPWFISDGSVLDLPDYFRVDGGINYQKDKIGFNLFVNNVLNKYLYSGGFYDWTKFYYWQAEPGTNYRFSVNYRF